MKKVLTVLLILVMIALPLSSAALQAPTTDDGRLKEMADLVESFINEQEYTYERDNSQEGSVLFTAEFNVENKFAEADVEVVVYDDLITVMAYATTDIPEARRDAVAAYMSRANWRLLFSHYNLNMENGQIGTYSALPCKGGVPSADDLDTVFHYPLWDWEDFGDGLYEVAFEDADPKEAFDKALVVYESESTD